MSPRHLFNLLPVVLALVLPAAYAQAPIADESAAIAEAAQRFMASGKPLFVSADKLKEMVANPATAPALISVCAPPDHAKASIPGSVNMLRGAFWKPPMQAKLPPMDKMVVAYCYTGTGAVGPAVVLNPAHRHRPANDPFVVDVRAPADFVKGHITGAINIPAEGVYQAGNLAKLPPGRRVVVADYTGQTAVGHSYLLSIMGYNARGLQSGMMGWSTNDALLGGFKRFPGNMQRNFAIAGTAAK